MVTPQQEKGFRLLEKLIRTKYPWISKLEIKEIPILNMTLSVIPHVNLKRFVDQYDLLDKLGERFDHRQDNLDHFVNYSCWHYMYSVIVGSPIDSEDDERYGMFDNRLNREIQNYMDLVYGKLPTEMTVKIFSGDPDVLEREAPWTYRSYFNMDTGELEGYTFPRVDFNIDCYQIIPESCTGLLGGV